ncbi:MAG: histidine phosphatase family protein [Bryobacteraceae bacterium]|nr:histidine phosphatase family protein [Bryobacteraceae bacterium]
MSTIYFFRHGQAGTRTDYDKLSPLGRRQARLLGEHCVREGLRFTAVYSGELTRQRETAAEFQAAYNDAGVPLPEITPHAGWNEFDLDDVWRFHAPLIAAIDADFRAEYETLRAAARDPESALQRQWSRCDMAVVMAWVEGRFQYPGESWQGFQERVASCGGILGDHRDGDVVAIFTSATPISVWVNLTLGASSKNILPLAGAQFNTAITSLRRHREDYYLQFFNAAPHLPPDIRTHR